eukprot:15088880-Ditylum_brightwellii.AAC.1
MGGRNGKEKINIGNWDRWSAASVHVLGKKKVRHISYDTIKDTLSNQDSYEMLSESRDKYYALIDEQTTNPSSDSIHATKGPQECSSCSNDNHITNGMIANNNTFSTFETEKPSLSHSPTNSAIKTNKMNSFVGIFMRFPETMHNFISELLEAGRSNDSVITTATVVQSNMTLIQHPI